MSGDSEYGRWKVTVLSVSPTYIVRRHRTTSSLEFRRRSLKRALKLADRLNRRDDANAARHQRMLDALEEARKA